jgi:hypothetical protein
MAFAFFAFFLPFGVISLCDVTLSSDNQFNISSFILNPSSSICINATVSPLFLAILAVPSDTHVKFYRAPFYGSPALLDFDLRAKALPWAVRALSTADAFVLETAGGGLFKLAVASMSFCATGVSILTSSGRDFGFGSEIGGDFRLSPNDQKCMLVVNPGATTVNVSLDFVGGDDQFFACRSLRTCQQATGKVNMSFLKGANRPMLFRMQIGSKSGSRAANFSVSGGSANDRLMYFGNNHFGTYTPPPLPAAEKTYTPGVAIPYLAGLISSSSVFLILITAVALRYQWATHCCGVNCGPRKPPDPLPPSAFVGRRNTYCLST